MSHNPCPKCSADRPGLETPCASCGWSPQTLAPPQPALRSPSLARAGRQRSLWWAYFIAPAVAPIAFAVSFFVFGLAALALNPEDTGTPAAVVAVPLFSLTAGIVISYFAAGAFGMPIVLMLDKRQMLNGYTVCGAALASSLIFLALSGALMIVVVPAARSSVTGLLGTIAGLWAVSAPFALASAATYWWIVSRGIQGMSLRALLLSLTVMAVLLGAAAPILRVLF